MAKLDKQKQATAPDAFQVVGVEASGWMMQHESKVILGVVVVVLIAAGVALASYVGDRGQARAAQGLGTALGLLERPIEGQPESAMARPDAPPFASEQAKDEAIRTELSTFREAHGGTRSATTAALPQAQADFRLGRYPEAQQGFEAYLKGAPAGTTLRLSALEGLGYSFEAQGRFDDALKAYGDLAREAKGAFLVGMGDFHRARVLAETGKKDEAAKTLRSVTTDHPGSAAARMAEERLTLLASQGVAIPAAPSDAPAPAADAG